MKSPGATRVRLFVDLVVATHGGKGHLVVIIGAIKLSMGGYGWCGVGSLEELDGDFGLWKELVPES